MLRSLVGSEMCIRDSMWIKDQYVDIFCRWVYLPLYAILAAISLNEST